jgi:NADH:ubiquinone oxidoreductase subunit 6 (subunit J)
MVQPLSPALFAAGPGAARLFPLGPALALGCAAVYLLLPRPRPYPSLWGAAAGTAALLLAGAFVVNFRVLDAETILFAVFAGASLVSGAMLVTQHRPARAALSFALVILSVSGLFLLLAAPFLAAATVTVYAGAIIVTFLFVIMLAQQAGADDADSRSREPLPSTLAGFVLLGALAYVLLLSYERSPAVDVIDDLLAQTRQARAAGNANVAQVAKQLRTSIDKAETQQLAIHVDTAELDEVSNRIQWIADDWETKRDNASDGLADMESMLIRARQQHGFLQPPGAAALVPLSDQSGPRANEPAELLRFGPDGRPRMPHDNAAYLGRSLFTDYLLPVELGGVLLLVATVGAIAIAHRVQPERRA